MQTIAHLKSFAAETDVFQWPLAQPRIDPETKTPRARPPNRPGPRQHAATVDPHRKIKRIAVFQRHRFRSELGTAVERDGRFRRKFFRHSRSRNSRWQFCPARAKRFL